MERVILHCDLNNFYASVECLHRPELRGKPLAVGGNPELRHGIILAKNYPAKACGVKTGEALWQAQQKCPGLIIVPPNYPLYLRFSRAVKAIFADYTDLVESFGIDEAWLDVTGSIKLFGSGAAIADTIRRRVTEELGLTASIGVSYNKIFAKLGSDLKKPDATSIISKDNYREVAWPLPVGELLYVGRATERKLQLIGVRTIGQLAQTPAERLHRLLGKWGEYLWLFANGYDQSPVAQVGEEAFIKSVGNGITCPRDVLDLNDVKIVLAVLADSVAARLREQGLKGTTVQIMVRDKHLASFTRQGPLAQPSFLAQEILDEGLELFRAAYPPRGGDWLPVRSLGIRACNLVAADSLQQLTIFCDEARREKAERLAATVDGLRGRFGHHCLKTALELEDRALSGFSPKEEHVIHPLAYFK